MRSSELASRLRPPRSVDRRRRDPESLRDLRRSSLLSSRFFRFLSSSFLSGLLSSEESRVRVRRLFRVELFLAGLSASALSSPSLEASVTLLALMPDSSFLSSSLFSSPESFSLSSVLGFASWSSFSSSTSAFFSSPFFSSCLPSTSSFFLSPFWERIYKPKKRRRRGLK